MSSNDEVAALEYSALMARGRDAERTWRISWTASGLFAALMLAWGISARNPGIMLPVVLSMAFGFYAMLQGRRQTRLIAGYIEEFHEKRAQEAGWFTKLGHLQVVPGFQPSSDWVSTCMANAVVLAAMAYSWMFSSATPRGELMAGIVSGCGLAFGFHSFTSISQLWRSDYAALWRQIASGPAEVKRERRVASY